MRKLGQGGKAINPRPKGSVRFPHGIQLSCPPEFSTVTAKTHTILLRTLINMKKKKRERERNSHELSKQVLRQQTQQTFSNIGKVSLKLVQWH